eukprot:TRINITY_DN17647_c0_g1_i3.p1 TRINITY_DN17647_c0_g1~~TRINITY_DN17647_c0_g1_i3.p1  ORF type:complete len:399 (+),score=84.28 TRINITY_DN17647_c0_g1_i3:78-1199(+)
MLVGVLRFAGGVGAGVFVASQLHGATARARQPARRRVQLASYNVLAPNYCLADEFCHSSPEDCDPGLRLQRVLGKLQAAVDGGYGVLCLQEVSHAWAGALHVWFAQRGFHFVYQGYGSESSDYMGCGLAWRLSEFEARDVSIVRLSSTKPTKWPEAPKEPVAPPPTFIQRLMALVRTPPPPPVAEKQFDPWKVARYRHNRAMMARLAVRGGGEEDSTFAVATYHMPCLFGDAKKQQAVNIHTALLMQAAQEFANGRPLVIAGDFNFKPVDGSYELVKNGSLPPSHPQAPEIPPWDSWRAAGAPMRSAYCVKNGKEPAYTQHAWPFTATLDYVWLSSEWAVEHVLDLPAQPDVDSYPTKDEPSDHLMVGATLFF